MSITAADLYALANGCKNKGNLECHWCTSQCSMLLTHDDVIPMPFVKSRHPTKRPANGFICLGCWLWRKKRNTITYLAGGYKDGQTAKDHSWLVTETTANVIASPADFEKLYAFLVKPTGSFALSFVYGEKKPENYLQMMLGNDLAEINGNTPIHFTVNNIPHSYTIYELEQAIKHGECEGKEPGIQALFYLHRPEKPAEGIQPPRKVGRPPKQEEPDDERITRKNVFTSGVQAKE